MIGGIGGAPGDICSRASCREPATWRIDWQNPRIHTGDRWKTWLACDEHVDYLRGFLEARSFPVRVAEFSGVLDDQAEVDS
ncbi:hypothetical protein BJ978_002649 [Agromyces terreus]|uniref:Acetone carboxylase n=1 Tax=Agromyces terreus TaxID=424795 RepID=A0A9X2H3L8_9MICO|nr:hypothetical protein [Agromyces terreus]MCP2371973.1 hypothetical protein [Agromyces terreus]